MKYAFLVILLLLIQRIGFAQTDSLDFSNPETFKLASETPKELEDYKKLLLKANQLYKEKKYAESVIWYRKVLQLKPDEKLSKFRIEDVYTLFISNKIVKDKAEAEKLISDIEFSLKEDEFNEMLSQQITEMRVKLKPKKKEPIYDYSKPLPVEKDEYTEEEQPITAKVEQQNNTKTEIQENKIVETKPEENKKPEVIAVTMAKTNSGEEQKPVVAENHEPDKLKTEPVVKTEDETKVKSLNPTPLELIPNAEEELKKLRETYTESRTEEVIEEPTKKTIRIVYNENGNITIYSKVIHNWGGIFFFMQKPPLPVQNISEEYFLRHSKE